jgi:hypothetical protein
MLTQTKDRAGDSGEVAEGGPKLKDFVSLRGCVNLQVIC